MPFKQTSPKHEPIEYPEGSRHPLIGKAGRCIVCDTYYRAKDIVRRAPYTLPNGNESGYRVCRWCSPSTPDYMVERYALPYDQWEPQWQAGYAADCFGRAVYVRRRTRFEESLAELNRFDDPVEERSDWRPEPTRVQRGMQQLQQQAARSASKGKRNAARDAQICELYATGNYTYKELSERFGINAMRIGEIVRKGR